MIEPVSHSHRSVADDLLPEAPRPTLDPLFSGTDDGGTFDIFRVERGDKLSAMLRTTPRSAFKDGADLADRIARSFGSGTYSVRLKVNGTYRGQRRCFVPEPEQPAPATLLRHTFTEPTPGSEAHRPGYVREEINVIAVGDDVEVVVGGAVVARMPLPVYRALASDPEEQCMFFALGRLHATGLAPADVAESLGTTVMGDEMIWLHLIPGIDVATLIAGHGWVWEYAQWIRDFQAAHLALFEKDRAADDESVAVDRMTRLLHWMLVQSFILKHEPDYVAINLVACLPPKSVRIAMAAFDVPEMHSQARWGEDGLEWLAQVRTALIKASGIKPRIVPA